MCIISLLFSLVEVFPDVGWQQAADPVIREEQVKVSQQAPLGFIRFIFFLQGCEWYYLEKEM